ncbi:hypothetical protein U9M48_032537 [Paspalum notatum var. saurae]|uniref:SET domain-containing protein n=1 Tax=Paspalum notatum var. saurae TaxID=547442 RepID=A0AAQ3U9I1_PASNO
MGRRPSSSRLRLRDCRCRSYGGRRRRLGLSPLCSSGIPKAPLHILPLLQPGSGPALRTSQSSREAWKLQCLAMEMRARESVNMSEDLTGAIAPYATALHDVFLQSHCSSCFTKLLPQAHNAVSCTTCCSVRYCCSECLSADSLVHLPSGECSFFVDHLKTASPSFVTEGTSDLRAAFRLLYVLEMHGLVSSDSISHYRRIGGLSASGIEVVLEEGEEISKKMLEGSLLMSSARKSRAQTSVSFSDGLRVEMMALWAVITNSVEVQLSEGLAMGVAVYGPSFSWFNHSCVPNASYRFVLAPTNGECASDKSKSCVVPASKGVAADVEARHSDLWSKYKFVCSCKRCITSPKPYIDLILNCDMRDLGKAEDHVTAPAVDDLGDVLEQAISEYSSSDDPKACCDMIESMLSNNLMNDLMQEEVSGRKYILHPMHHICLTSYMTLASAYRFRSLSLETGSLDGENTDEFFRMAKAAAAYSFILVGATHHLFLSECSLMIPLSHFLLNTGHSMLYLVDSVKGETTTNVSEANFTFSSCPSSSTKSGSTPYHEFRSTCEGFGKQILSLSSHCWPFLVQSLPFLEKIKNPIEFSWLGTAICQPVHLSGEDHVNFPAHEPVGFTGRQRQCILSLALCCITYCKYLASICYGPQHYLAVHAKDLLEVLCYKYLLSYALWKHGRTEHILVFFFCGTLPYNFEMADEYDQSSYRRSGANDDEGGYNKSTDDYGSTGGYNKSTDDYGSGGGYKKSSTDDNGSGGGYNKSSTDDYGRGGGYNKSSTDDYGSGGGYNKPNTDDYGTDGGYNKPNTGDYGSGGGHNKPNTDDYGSGGGYNKPNTDDYGSGGGNNKPSADDYGSGGGYNKPSADDYVSGGGYNKSGTDDYSGSGGFNKSSTDDYGSGSKDSNTGEYGRSDEYKKPSSNDDDGGYKDSSTDGYGGSGYNKSSTDDYGSGKNISNTDEYSGSGGYNKSSTDNYGEGGYNKDSSDGYGRTRTGKSGTDNYSGDYGKSGSDEYNTGSGRNTTDDY